MRDSEMIAQLEGLRRGHLVVEDCWYSCPKSGECCNSSEGDDCNCGADAANAALDEVLAELRWRAAPLATTAERFEKFVYPDPNSGCHLFAGYWDPNGYGQFRYLGKPKQAHLVAWLLAGRAIPAGLYLLHKCDTPCCVNIDHLFLGTQMDNMGDMARKGRGHSGSLPYGVWRQRNGRFGSRLMVRGRLIRLGTYDTAEEASAAASAARQRERT